MNLKRSFRTLMIFLLLGLLLFGLASCRLPASSGPQTGGTSSAGFPVPGETQPATGQIDVSKFATQTARVVLPVVISPGDTQQSPTQAYPSPIATIFHSSPVPTATNVATATEVEYIQPTPGGPPETYTLQEGEYPFCIARRFDVSQVELLTLNGLTPDSFFYAGQELKIPQTGTPFEGERTMHEHPTTYEVEEGDSLGSIACYFGDVSPDIIALQNDLPDANLTVGAELIIP